MTNKQILKLHKNKKMIEVEYKLIESQIKKLEKKMESIGEKLYYIDKVDEIYKGVAISYGAFYSFEKTSTEDDFIRRAKFYVNANDSKLFGVSIYSGVGYGYGNETWKGANWKSKAAAIIACKEYVCFGIEPPFNGVEK